MHGIIDHVFSPLRESLNQFSMAVRNLFSIVDAAAGDTSTSMHRQHTPQPANYNNNNRLFLPQNRLQL
jgi:hypothetical protein